MSCTEGGFQGNASGSDETPSRPSVVIVSPVAPSRMTSVGMPLTLNFFESAAFALRSSNGSASHGCSAKYSSKAPWSLSLETKTTSRPLSLSDFVYQPASCGVKPRQGGHQCAEK